MRIIFTIIFCFLSGIAAAASPVSFVSGPSVTAGQTAVEGRIGYTIDNESAVNDQRIQSRLHLDHGFTDIYALRIIAAQDKIDGDHFSHDNFTFENRFHLFKKQRYGFDGGARLVYTKRNGDASRDGIAVNFIGQKDFGSLQARHNVILKHDIGANARNGVSLELRHQLTTKTAAPEFATTMRYGVEMFNDFGNLSRQSGYSNQDHQIGPVLKMGFRNGLSIETGYRLGVSNAARDHIFKFSLAKNF